LSFHDICLRRCGRLACDVVEKHGFIAHRARVQISMGRVAFWTQPIATAIDFKRAGFRTATETGDLTFACYSLSHIIADVLVRNDPLDAVWRESDSSLAGTVWARDLLVTARKAWPEGPGRCNERSARTNWRPRFNTG
jgi:hypothetical protein